MLASMAFYCSGKTEVRFEFRPGITSSQNIEKGATQLLVSQHFYLKTILKYPGNKLYHQRIVLYLDLNR